MLLILDSRISLKVYRRACNGRSEDDIGAVSTTSIAGRDNNATTAMQLMLLEHANVDVQVRRRFLQIPTSGVHCTRTLHTTVQGERSQFPPGTHVSPNGACSRHRGRINTFQLVNRKFRTARNFRPHSTEIV